MMIDTGCIGFLVVRNLRLEGYDAMQQGPMYFRDDNLYVDLLIGDDTSTFSLQTESIREQEEDHIAEMFLTMIKGSLKG